GDALAEGLVDREAVLAGAGSALSRASRYVAGRRWRRERDRPTTGIVVKGGAATGIFSAGVVWTVLHMIHGCMSDPACGAAPPGASRPRRDLRFQLLSGTSTGAMVAIAVDLWSSAETAEARERGIKNLAKWFTCYSLSDLYCVRSAPITRLFESGDGAEKGVLEFDGIEKVLTSCVDDRMRANGAELILNTVDFRTGRLYALSDQAELVTTGDVVQAGLASALLPVIGQPVSKLPVWNPGVGEAVYLDGGIRSEIPLLPLARRGAERVLVVSSSASVLNETRPLKNALSIATRYIDVSTGGVTESELAHASRHAESIRAAEIEACTERLRADSGRLCPPESGCNVRSICRTLDWGSACSPPRDAPIEGDEGADPPAPQPATAPQPAAAPSGPERMRRVVLGDHTIADPRALSILVEPFWAVHGIFRNEDKIDAINGYKFEPAELRRMFRAGAEAARLRCTDLARLLGVVPGKEISSDLEKKLVRWCSPDLPRPAELCDAAPRADGGLRSCGEPPPSFLDACSSAAPPGPGAEGSAR
ncbi:MAG: patatin-like phospholipase family protein, partial [Polyangiaceae bacterium]|nr:patatin-like phospholipase family protein [Polyangiaceae bacterium]